jgi:hypothetical protein
MKKGIILIIILLTVTGGIFALEDDSYISEAEELKSLDLFLGTDQGFELDREASRLEAVVMLIRLLGKESEAKLSEYSHPFVDVPQWGHDYVGYAYEKGLTLGISESKFGSDMATTELQFFTFALRALGYDDKNGDFVWSESKEKATTLGLINSKYLDNSQKQFLRSHCVAIAHQSLMTPLKESDRLLLDDLVYDGHVDSNKAELLKVNYGLEQEKVIENPDNNALVTHRIDLASYMSKPVAEVYAELKEMYGKYITKISFTSSTYVSLIKRGNQEASLSTRMGGDVITNVKIGYNVSGGQSRYGVIVSDRLETINGYYVNEGVQSLLDQIGIGKADFTQSRTINDFNLMLYSWDADGGNYMLEVIDDFSHIFGLSFSLDW